MLFLWIFKTPHAQTVRARDLTYLASLWRVCYQQGLPCAELAHWADSVLELQYSSVCLWHPETPTSRCRGDLWSKNVFLVLAMQNTALCFTERSGHCGATNSDNWSWHPSVTSEGDKVVSYTVSREQESSSNSLSVNVTLVMTFCWCHFAIKCPSNVWNRDFHCIGPLGRFSL